MPTRPEVTGRRRLPSTPTETETETPAPIVPLPGAVGGQLLYDRRQACHLLRVSKSTLRRMEERGLLEPLRPSGSPNGLVCYRGANLLQIAGGGAR